MATKFYLSPRPDKKGECPIRVSISIRGTRLISTAGFNIAPGKWNEETHRVKKGAFNEDKIPSNIINARLKKIDAHFSDYEIRIDHRPSLDELSAELAAVKGTTRRRNGRKEASTALDYLNKFISEEGHTKQWTDGTLMNWQTFRKHLREYGETATLSDFNENGLARFIDTLRTQQGLGESSIQKEYKHLRWFLKWAIRKGYTSEDAVTRYRPKFKLIAKPVIFLTKEELMRLYHYEIPTKGTEVKLTNHKGEEYTKTIAHPEGLSRARDIFCFCCFTSLRYSDAVKLKKTDIEGGYINVVTKKTDDKLQIDLNNYSSAILDKFKDKELPGNAALPYLSVHMLDDFIKELGELCGFNEQIPRTVYKGGKRLEMTQDKWRMLSSHAGRRTFICYALSIGISPQVVMRWTGHSDYAAMKPYIAIADTAKQKAMQDFNKGMEE